VLQGNHEAETGAIKARDAKGVDLHDRADATVDLLNFRLGPVLLGKVQHHHLSQPLGRPEEVVLALLHTFQSDRGASKRKRDPF
jgi:hypothetical protein